MPVKRMKSVRWGRVREISHVKSVRSSAFKALPNRLKHLSAWRRMHMQSGGHASVRGYGTVKKVRPSSNLRLRGSAGSKFGYLDKKGL